MEAASTSEKSVNVSQPTCCNNPKGSHLHIRCRQNLKSHLTEPRSPCPPNFTDRGVPARDFIGSNSIKESLGNLKAYVCRMNSSFRILQPLQVLYVFHVSPMGATQTARFRRLGLIIQIIFGEETYWT
jgi:hypothetical protein